LRKSRVGEPDLDGGLGGSDLDGIGRAWGNLLFADRDFADRGVPGVADADPDDPGRGPSGRVQSDPDLARPGGGFDLE
jgi:hypothetical protein